MVRFSAGEREIIALVRFLGRRAPGGLWMLPLEAAHRDGLRFRRTSRRFLHHLSGDDGPLSWGLLPWEQDAAGGLAPRSPFARRRKANPVAGDSAGAENLRPLQIDPDEAGLIVLDLGPAHGPERRREGVLATRDPLPPRPDSGAASVSPPQTNKVGAPLYLRADLVEKCARHLRRKGQRIGGRWRVAE